MSNIPLLIKLLNVFIAFRVALVLEISKKSFLNTLKGKRRSLANQSGKGMKKELSLLVEISWFFAESRALLVSFKIKRVSADTL
ncbi:MAG: hypothetical protein U5J96_18875 [Ignavibacteriaceae bacterium]|nr:hypothetical protein [Ignavibacteriaceae bacterium]